MTTGLFFEHSYFTSFLIELETNFLHRYLEESMLGWLLSLCFCADELHILPLIFSLIIGLGFSAVFSSAWQCRGAAGSL
jgi:hypothetical protein